MIWLVVGLLAVMCAAAFLPAGFFAPDPHEDPSDADSWRDMWEAEA